MRKNKRWLVAFYLFFSLQTLLGILMVSFLDAGEERTYGMKLLLSTALWAPLIYIFGYREKGTKLLLWTVLSGTVSVSNCSQSCAEYFREGQTAALTVVLVILCTCVWFLLECFLLREDNKKFREDNKKFREMRKLNPILEETCAS